MTDTNPDAITGTAPIPPRRRVSNHTKLLIAGVGFPTLLLILATVFLTWKLPQVRGIEELERRIEEENKNPKLGQFSKSWTVGIRLNYPFAEKPVKYFTLSGSQKVDEKYKWLGTVVQLDNMGQDCTNDDMDFCARFSNVEEVRIIVDELEEEALKHLPRLSSLKELTLLIWPNLTPGGVPGGVTDRGLEWIAQNKRLRDLSIYQLKSVTPEGMAKLQTLPELTHLMLGEPRLSDEVMHEVLRIPKLTQLHFNGSEITESTIRLLATQGRIKVACWNPLTTPEGFRALADIEGLESMLLNDKYILPEDAFTGFPGKSRLESLQVGSPLLTGPMLKRIAGIETLQDVKILKGSFEEADLAAFYKHPNLKHLRVPPTISQDAIKALRDNLPGVEVTQ